MKRILSIAVIAATLTACNNSATVDSEDTMAVDTMTTVTTTPVYSQGDVIKRDGKVYVYDNNDWVVTEKDVTLDSGVIVTSAGEVRNKNGKTVTLQEGEYVNRAGNFFDRTGAAIEDGWDATKRGVSDAAQATKEGMQRAGDSIAAGANRIGDKVNDAVK